MLFDAVAGEQRRRQDPTERLPERLLHLRQISELTFLSGARSLTGRNPIIDRQLQLTIRLSLPHTDKIDNL